MLLAQAANQALWEGVLALVAAVLVASLTVHMWRAGRHMKREIEGRLEAVVDEDRRARRSSACSSSRC